jgi:hypothetical protein
MLLFKVADSFFHPFWLVVIASFPDLTVQISLLSMMASPHFVVAVHHVDFYLNKSSYAEHSWMQEHADQTQDSCSHCHGIGLRREDLGSCSFSTPLATRSRDVSFNTGGPIACQGMSDDEACSPTFACRSSFSAFVPDMAPSCSMSGFSFGEASELGGGVAFPTPPVASMPSFSFFCAQECGEPEPSGSQGVSVAAAAPSTSRRMSEVMGTARPVTNQSRGAGINSRRNHTIGAGEREPLDVAVAESVIRWASCTNLSTTHSLRASLVC